MSSFSSIKNDAQQIAGRSSDDVKQLAELIYELAKKCDDMDRDVTQAKSDAASAKRDSRR
jgi:hypothetical protein